MYSCATKKTTNKQKNYFGLYKMQNWCYNIEMMPVWAEGEKETNTSQNEGQGSNKNSCRSISQCKIYYIHSVSSYLYGHEQTNIQDLSFLHFLQCASHTRQITATNMKRKVDYIKQTHTHEYMCGSKDDNVTLCTDCHSVPSLYLVSKEKVIILQ